MCRLPVFADRARSHCDYIVKCVWWRWEILLPSSRSAQFAPAALLVFLPPLCHGSSCAPMRRGPRCLVSQAAGNAPVVMVCPRLGATSDPRAAWAAVCEPTGAPRLSTMALCTTDRSYVGDVGLRRQGVRQWGDRKHDQPVARICRYHSEKRHRHKEPCHTAVKIVITILDYLS